MKSKYLYILKGFCLLVCFIGTLIKAQYPDFSQSYNYSIFLKTNNPSGGGSVTASVNSNVFTLNFNAGFTESYLKNGPIATLDGYTINLPNTEIPIPTGNFFADKGYRFYLINNKICVYYGISQVLLPITSFMTTLSVNLLSPVNPPAEVVDYIDNYSSQNNIVTTDYLTDQGRSGNKKISIMYFDGLGREMENVLVAYTPSGKDLINFSKYDEYGRLNKEFLPVPSSRGTGLFTPESNVLSFASSIYNGEVPFSEKIFDESPLNRVIKQAAPGNAWQNGSGHEIKYEESINSSSDNVKTYGTSVSLDFYEPSFINSTGYYVSGTLFKRITKDEDWTTTSGNNNTTEEYINKQGQTVLVRKYVNNDKADTYYIYDIFGNLTYVVSPEASVLATINQTTLDNLCYQYKYDKKNRLIEKKLPGKGKEYMVYDLADRLVLSQDANLGQSGKWLITKYDLFGRVAYTGVIAGGDRENMQNQINSLVIIESPNSTGFVKSGLTVYYTNNYFTSIENVLSVNYYDTVYPYLSHPSNIQGVSVIPSPSGSNGTVISLKGMPIASFTKNIDEDLWTKNFSYYDIRGRTLATHSYNTLGGFTKTENVLDFAGVPQKIFTYHKRGGLNVATVTIEENFTYDNQNRLTVHTHKVNNNAPVTLADNEYNEIGQLTKKKVGGDQNGNSPLQTINYKYNVRGWLTNVNDPASITSMGTDLFGYKIRYSEPIAGLQTPSVSYPNLEVKPRYNGNIAEIEWNAVDDLGSTSPMSQPYRYGYVYDGLNRLQAGFYQDPFNPSKGTNNEIIEQYDLNGNIKKLKRFAHKPKSGTAAKIDDLTYTYSGNMVTNISDGANNVSGYEGGNGLIEYDLNGNMFKMPDKGITNIVYNFLNLPQEIIQVNNTKYFYKADGSKFKKTFTLNNAVGSTVFETEYLDGFQYVTNESSIGPEALRETDDNTVKTIAANEIEAFVPPIDNGDGNDAVPGDLLKMVLSFVPTAEGYYDFRKNQYIYQYKDHLGNARLSYAKNKTTNAIEILDRNDYYPFGMSFFEYHSVFDVQGQWYNNKYNGKELQETGMYDYGARMYMPDIARWGVMDNYTENYNSLSPYNYVAGNPIKYVDVNGEWIYISDPSGNQYRYHNGATQHQVDGKWTNIDKSTTLSDYVLQTVAGLNYLDRNTSAGKEMISYFDQGKGDDGKNRDITFAYTSGESVVRHGISNIVDLNPSGKGVWTTAGHDAKYSPLYTTIAHEMGHVYANFALGENAQADSRFGPNSSTAEIYGAHIENTVRAETGIPLRTNYGSFCIGSTCGPNSEGRLIDNAGNSIYYNSNGTQTTPIPSVKEVLKVNNTILQNKYNYHGAAAYYQMERFKNRAR